MSKAKQNTDSDDFKVRVEQLVEREFGSLSRVEIAAALTELATRFRKPHVKTQASDLQEDSASGWTGRISSRVVLPMIPQQAGDEDQAAMAAVCIEASSVDQVASLLHQTLQVGAVLVTLSPSPPLNAIVALNLQFPLAHLTLETRGRVVHVSQRGTAIEVSGLNKEDRAALQAMYEDNVKYVVADAPSPGSEASSGSDHVSVVAGSALVAASEPVAQAVATAAAASSEGAFDVGLAVEETPSDDQLRSFAPYASRGGASAQSGRTLAMTTRRRVDLPDPDENILSTTEKTPKSSATREFYGPELPWLKPSEDPDRIEDLAEDRIVDILLQISESGFTGILEYEGQGLQRQVYFDSGYLVESSRSPRVAEEELGPMLQAADRITKRQLAMGAAHADEFDLTFERSLLELDVLDPDRIRHAIAGRLTYLLREICELNSGHVRIFSSNSLVAGFLPQPPLRVHVAIERIVFDRLIKRLGQLPIPEREAIIAHELDTYPEVVAQDRDRLDRAVVSEEHRRLLDRVVTGRRRLREVFTESGLAPAETFAVVYALHRMGLLRFDRSLHHTVVRERLRENITVKYLSVHKASFFEVLNVHWSSYDEVVEKAYRDLIVQFDPTMVPDQLESEVHQRVSEIRERIDAAYKVLVEREPRHAYRMRIMPEYKLAHAIPLFLKQSELAERRRQWVEARDALRRVLEIDPVHGDGVRRLKRINALIDKGNASSPADTH
ncbi:MAG: hypothetical protein H0U74_02605 [Bradymonadaceae bacterium]|nr:hypothetical protein [Lujinxingiaceae bacterium]